MAQRKKEEEEERNNFWNQMKSA